MLLAVMRSIAVLTANFSPLLRATLAANATVFAERYEAGFEIKMAARYWLRPYLIIFAKSDKGTGT